MARPREKTTETVERRQRVVTYVTVTKKLMTCERPYVLFGEEVRTARLKLGWTQLELSSAMKLSRASISNIETGRQRILLTDLIDFAEVLGLDSKKLFARCLA